MKLFIIAGVFLIAASSMASDIICAKKSKGFLPFNQKTGVWIGEGYLSQKGNCHEAIDTHDANHSLVCSWAGSGWNLYNSKTGVAFNEGKYVWTSFDSCKVAAESSRLGMVCAPFGNGHGVYDIDNGYFIGSQYYFKIEDCLVAAGSADAGRVCAGHGGYTAVFCRRYNSLVVDGNIGEGELFFEPRQCVDRLFSIEYQHRCSK